VLREGQGEVMKKPDRNVRKFSGDLFTWVKNVGYAEASTLNIPVGQVPGSQIWNDSQDVGFIVKSHKTGVEKLFTLQSERTEAAMTGFGSQSSWEEIREWIFTSSDGIKLKIYNG
jgi:hypothetical protein